jgi:hypothetical protein
MNLAAKMKRTSSCAAFSLAAALLFSAPLAQAGPLASDLAISYGGAWAGSTHFMTGTLEGDVEWAVYEAANFPYTGAGYTPTPGQLVYAYQVYITGAAPLSHLDVDLPNPGNNIGSFTSFGVESPSGSSIGPIAAWEFAGVGTGSSTIGLAYSSDKTPQDWFGSVVDHGQSTFVMPLPAPSSISIPEPAAVTLICLGAALLLPGVVRRWLRR